VRPLLLPPRSVLTTASVHDRLTILVHAWLLLHAVAFVCVCSCGCCCQPVGARQHVWALVYVQHACVCNFVAQFHTPRTHAGLALLLGTLEEPSLECLPILGQVG
jgi:hypothetical protein